MEDLLSYPYESAPNAMQHAHTGAGSQTAADSRMTKRRRLDSTSADELAGASSGSGDPAAHHGWSDHTSGSSSTQAFAPSQLVPPYRSNAEYIGQHAPSAIGSAEATQHWQQPETHPNATSAYPDLTAYQQQPYFYDQQRESGAAYGHPSNAWSPADAQYPAASHSTPYATRDQATNSAMPYFPPTTVSIHENGDVADGSHGTTYQYGEIEHPSSYPYPPATGNAGSQSDQLVPASTCYFAGDDASMNMKIQSLPILDNLATQLIQTLSKASYAQIKELMSGGDAEESQAYVTLKNLFDQTRKVYSRDTPFIDAIAIQMFQPAQQEIIRKANIATFISSILGAFDVTFYHLNEYFMETFVPLGHRLLKWQGAIYLEMKTQTYISSLLNSQGNPEDLLDELFPPDLDAQILTRHPDAPSLSPSEQDFFDRSRARKSYLLAEPASAEAARELQKKYSWQDFSREFAACINKNIDSIMSAPARTQTGGSKSGAASGGRGVQESISGPSGGAAAGLSSAGLLTGAADTTSAASNGASGSSNKKSSTAAATVRQPWTKQEEDALLAGLERVNGPHWSQILALYGRGGAVSEVLKDRNQVQLKDKARNLKLWYLKTGRDVPPALRGVTGELRKRGGARARAALGLMEEDDGGRDTDANGGEEGMLDPSFDQDRKDGILSGGSSKKKGKK